MAIAKARSNRCVQVNVVLGGSSQSLRESMVEHCRVDGAAADFLRFLRRRALAGVGMIARRRIEFGAKTPGAHPEIGTVRSLTLRQPDSDIQGSAMVRGHVVRR